MNKVSDNMELDFPARMADGRQFTNYNPNCYMNYNITGDKGSWNEKQYLIQNAGKIHENMMKQMNAFTKCSSCTDNTVLPVKTMVNCLPDTCNYNVVDKMGIGQGRDMSQGPSFQ